MKSLTELESIKNENLYKVDPMAEGFKKRVLVGLATCGIAAGAQPVMNAFQEELKKRNLSDIQISQTGCIGVCRLEPMVEVYFPNEEKVTYVKMTPEKVRRIVSDHLVNGNIVNEYTIGYWEQNNQ